MGGGPDGGPFPDQLGLPHPVAGGACVGPVVYPCLLGMYWFWCGPGEVG